MNLGIREAASLAEKLAKVLGGSATESLLDSYETERLAIARKIVGGTHVATRILMLQNRAARRVRNTLASFLLNQPLVQRQLTSRLSGLQETEQEVRGRSPG